MSKLLLLYLTFVVTLLFMLIPDNDVTVGYLFYDKRVSLEYYVYSIFEKLVLIALAYIIANEATEYRLELKIFLWLLIADLADSLLTYNSIWFRVGAMPISMNVLKCTIFGLTILNAWIRTLFK